MNILMVLENQFPPDERIENEINILLKYGFQVVLACTKRGGKTEVEKNAGPTIWRLPLSKFIYKSGAVALELPFYFSFWHDRISKIIEQSKIDAIHLHDLPLIKVCLRLAHKYNLPLISDFHENRPEIMRMYRHVQSFPGKYIISLKRWMAYQLKYTKETDHLILVTDEARDYYINNYRIDPGKIIVLPNFISLNHFRDLLPEKKMDSDLNENFTVVYLGNTGLRRGTLTLLETAEKLKDRNIRFIVIGTSREHPVLEQEAVKRRLNNVRFTGWLPLAEAVKYINISDIGVCPFLRNVHHDTTYANKMFQYMALGKPVVVSDCTAQANFVQRENCGLVFEAGNADELANQIIKLTNTAEYDLLSKNARKCVHDKYNWETYGKRLVDLYSNLQGNKQN